MGTFATLNYLTNLHIDSQREGRPTYTIYSAGDKDAAPFWKLVGGDESHVKKRDNDTTLVAQQPNRLMVISDASGKLTMTEVATGGKVRLSHFDTNSVHLLDANDQVFVWVGKKASGGEKSAGLRLALEYLSKYNRPAHTPVSRVV